MNVKPRHVSDSLEQREAEVAVLTQVNKERGYSLAGDAVPVGDGVVVRVDGIDRERRVMCEVYSRIGRLKGSQPHKIASDMLKLALAERELGGKWLKLICFADSEAAKCVQGKSWLAVAALRMGFEVIVVELPSAIKERLLSAQRRQVMVNPSGASDAETLS